MQIKSLFRTCKKTAVRPVIIAGLVAAIAIGGVGCTQKGNSSQAGAQGQNQGQADAQGQTDVQGQTGTQGQTGMQGQAGVQGQNQGQAGTNTAQGTVTLDTAKAAALSDANVSAADATFTKEQMEMEDGVSVYDLKFYTATTEYEYEIHAVTGQIYSRSAENFYIDGGNAASGNYISAEDAKSTAVSHAGFGTDEVTFVTVRLERDDMRMEYEVDFYQGTTKYDYTLDATNGTILEYDIEYYNGLGQGGASL